MGNKVVLDHLTMNDGAEYAADEKYPRAVRYTYRNINCFAAAVEIANWYCPAGYIVTYDSKLCVAFVKDLSKSGSAQLNADRVTLFESKDEIPVPRKPRARFVRVVRRDKKDIPVSLVSVEIFDFDGNAFSDVKLVAYPKLASEAPLKTTDYSTAFLGWDLKADREIAGVRITNVTGAEGANLIGCMLQVVTLSGIPVFGVPIRDNRTVYNIRTAPLTPELCTKQYLYNIVNVETGKSGCCSAKYDTRGHLLQLEDEKAMMKEAKSKPETQLDVNDRVDFTVPLVAGALAAGAVAAYNDPPKLGGYCPYSEASADRLSAGLPRGGCGGSGCGGGGMDIDDIGGLEEINEILGALGGI